MAYTSIDNDLFDDEFLCGQEKLLLVVLIRYWNNEKGYAYPNYETLMRKTDMSKATLRKHLMNLEKKNYIEIIKHRSKTIENNTYKIKKYLCLENELCINDEKLIAKSNQGTKTKLSQGLKTKPLLVQKLNTTSTIYTNTNNIYMSVFDYWNEKNIKRHRVLNNDIKKAIDKALKIKVEDEFIKEADIKSAIDNYKEVLDSDYFFNYKWGLAEFLTRKQKDSSANQLVLFLDNGATYENYKRQCKKPQDKPQEQAIYKTKVNNEKV
ncbi:helix-turn-helix domain-containing protein [Clostridium sp. YIM B02506]|uniref:helix-turn-helix domain-containing protein n=1 Tax=Clostridium sp. YIM B02506 TaxID=2910680 RepID=UPI001EEF4176|nr:helix-turn-helix domain-containing protein [Clostridium sp. YIM B02506]